MRHPAARGTISSTTATISALREHTTAFRRGASRRYCNACFVVLGMLVERLSGEDYYAYVRRTTLPAGGHDPHRVVQGDSLPPDTAIGYTRDVDGNFSAGHAPPPEHGVLPGRGSAAGGGYSTVGDLLLFVTALRASSIPRARRPASASRGGRPDSMRSWRGKLPGRYDLAVAANLDPPAAEQIAGLVREWLGVPKEDDPGGP